MIPGVNEPGAAVVLFHDYFSIRGGGERLALTLARALDASLIFGYRTEESFDASKFPSRSTSLHFPSFLKRAGLRPLVLAILFSAQRKVARNFPIRIFSGVAAPFSAPCQGGAGVNIFYCHTPPRFLYDQRQYFLQHVPLLFRWAARVLLRVFEVSYRRSIARMDVIVTNSENTRNRIRRYLGQDSIVVYPPVDTDRFVWQGQRDYYLSTARLSGLKRVDLIVEAFLKMPDKKLTVASGGEELERLKRKAAAFSNIEFRNWVSDNELRELVGNAIATIYLPRDEDFGISPVESMAAGKPVIGVAEGGMLETVLPGMTGILLKPDFKSQDIMAAVMSLTPERALSMRSACENRARDFTRQKFISGMRAVISWSRTRAVDKA